MRLLGSNPSGPISNRIGTSRPHAQSLVVEDEISDFIGKLCALPLVLPATSLLALIFGSSRADGLIA
jgi:hypothetical protein